MKVLTFAFWSELRVTVSSTRLAFPRFISEQENHVVPVSAFLFQLSGKMDNQEAWDLEITFLEANGENESEVEETDFANLAGSHSENDEIQNCLGGYEYQLVDETTDNQKCPVCLFPMRDSVQTESCGDRLCRECPNGIPR